MPKSLAASASLPLAAGAAVLALPAVIAVFAGVRLVQVMPERLFFRLVTWALLLISLKLIWDGARGLI